MRVIDRFWDLIVLPTCNDRSDAVSAQQAILVFQLGLLRDAHGADIGVAKQGLSVVAEAALGAFQAAGGETLLGSAARSLDHDGERVTGVVLGNGERRAAAGVVAALPPHRVAELLPEEWRGRFSALDQFELAPIVNVHVEWDRAVLREPFVAVLDPSVQYVFNRSLITEQDGPTQWVTCSLSGRTLRRRWRRERWRRRHRWSASSVSGRGGGGGAALAGGEGDGSDVPAEARARPVPAGDDDIGGEPPAGGRVDRHGVARNDGVRRAQRASSRARLAGADLRGGQPQRHASCILPGGPVG